MRRSSSRAVTRASRDLRSSRRVCALCAAVPAWAAKVPTRRASRSLSPTSPARGTELEEADVLPSVPECGADDVSAPRPGGRGRLGLAGQGDGGVLKLQRLAERRHQQWEHVLDVRDRSEPVTEDAQRGGRVPTRAVHPDVHGTLQAGEPAGEQERRQRRGQHGKDADVEQVRRRRSEQCYHGRCDDEYRVGHQPGQDALDVEQVVAHHTGHEAPGCSELQGDVQPSRAGDRDEHQDEEGEQPADARARLPFEVAHPGQLRDERGQTEQHRGEKGERRHHGRYRGDGDDREGIHGVPCARTRSG